MHLDELPPDGLLRRFRVAFPAAPIEEEREQRLQELGAGLGTNSGLSPEQREAMLSRSAGAIHADIVGKSIERAVRVIMRERAIRAAGRPAITLGERGAAGEYVVQIAIETLPVVTPPDLRAITLDQLVAEPGATEVAEARIALRRRHGTWHDVPDGTLAAPEDELTADIRAWQGPNLLRNPGAQGAADHPRGLPTYWEMLPHGALEPSVERVGIVGGRGFVDLRLRGTMRPENRAFFAFESWNAIQARPGQAFAFLVDLRHVAGDLPADVEFELSIDEFGGVQPGHSRQGRQGKVRPSASADVPGVVGAAGALSDHAEVAHVRPALFIGGATHEAVDFTLRITQPCLLSPLLPSLGEAPVFASEALAFRLGGDEVLPGLDVQLAAMAVGETRRALVAAPFRGADSVGGAAGRDLVVEASLRRLRRLRLPDADAAFARLCGAEDLAALDATLRAELRAQFLEMGRRLTRNALLARLAAEDGVQALPESLVRREMRSLHEAAQAEARLPPADIAERAARRVRLRLAVRALGETLGVRVAPEQVEAALAREAAQFPGQEAEALAFLRNNSPAARRVADQLWSASVVDRLLEMVQVTERPATPTALFAATEAVEQTDGWLDDAL